MDEKKYVVKKNHILKDLLSTLENNYDIWDVQQYIDKLISWYSIKFSDQWLESFFKDDSKVNMDILKIMNFEALQKNYVTFERELFDDSTLNERKIILRKYLIVVVGWGLIYHKNTSPEFGFYRATRLLEDFNSCYGWNLNSSIYKPILEREYSLHNPEIVQLLKEKKKDKKEISSNDKFFKLKKYVKSRKILKK